MFALLEFGALGGIGKTTLARVVYEMVSNQFEACSFITDVRENSENSMV
jgi:replication-associated recombination protein RarA